MEGLPFTIKWEKEIKCVRHENEETIIFYAWYNCVPRKSKIIIIINLSKTIKHYQEELGGLLGGLVG